MNACDLTANFPIQKPTGISSWRGLLAFEKNLFVFVNVMDIVMTSRLLNTGAFTESNPIANHILSEWGFAGMVVFKLIVVAAVMLIANVIALKRVRTSRNLLHFGTFVVGAVVTYSVALMMMHHGWI